METGTQAASASKGKIITGWALSALPSLMLLFFGALALAKPPQVIAGMEHLGYPESRAVIVGLLEIVCTIIYLIPRTSVLGAVLLTGYLGGATASHVRIGEPPILPIIVAGLFWLGLYLREPRLHKLLPFRS
jgi:hypothetical protein